MIRINSYLNIKILIIFIIFAFIFTYKIIFSKDNLGIQDWDMHIAYLESARESVLKYKQFPFWNPYICGGIPSFGHPESSIFSLTFFFVLIFTTLYGIKISIFVHYFIGMVGFYLLLTDILKMKKESAFFGSFLFSLSGVVSSAIGVGMLPFLYIFYLPLIYWSFIKGIKNNKLLLLTSLFWSLEFYSNYQIAIITLPSFLLFSFFLSIFKKDKRPFFYAIFVIILSIFISLPKVLLSIQFTNQYLRKILDFNSGYTIKGLIYFLIAKNQPYYLSPSIFNINYGIDESSLYTGIIPLFFFFLGLFKIKKKGKHIQYSFLILLFINFLLMMGDFSPINLWRFLKGFPIYDQFRVAQRFRFSFILFFSVISALGWDFFFKKIKLKYLRYILLILVFFNFFLFTKVNFFSKSFIIKNFKKIAKSKKFIQIDNLNINYFLQDDFKYLSKYDSTYLPWSQHYLAIKQNKGIIDCYIASPINTRTVSSLDKNYLGEAYFLKSKKTAEIEYWSPNKIIIIVPEKLENDILVINQNYNKGWLVLLNGKIKKVNNYLGLISYKLNGERKITFFYNPYKSFFHNDL